MTTLSRKSQVTVPKEIRDALRIEPGSEADWKIENGKTVLKKLIPTEAFDKWQGYLRGKLPAASVDETMEMLRGEREPIGEAVLQQLF